LISAVPAPCSETAGPLSETTTMRKNLLLAALVTALLGCNDDALRTNAAADRVGEMRRTEAVRRIESMRRIGDLRRIIENAKDKVFPALVYVKPIREEFSTGEKKKQEVFGSGVIISPDGLIVTNNHVAEKAIHINCVLYDKQQWPAVVVGLDPETDIALLKLQRPPGSPPLPYGEFADSSKVKEGEFVMAMGSPFGFARSVSLGIISNTRRYIGFHGRYRYNTWLQTDAAINVGNSGGPLVNTDGKIVGINTLTVFMAENVGFAIPADIVKEIVRRLKKSRRIKRSWSGIRLQALKDFYSNTFARSDRGVLVADVDADSPAERAGLRAGDILLAVNDSPVDGIYAEDLPAIRWRLADLPVGRDARLTVRRGGKEITLTLRPALKGSVEGSQFDCKRWNMTVKEINKFDDPQVYYYRKKGVFIQAVKRPGNASDSGLRPNDVILKIEDHEINGLDDVKTVYERLIADDEREKKALFHLLRGGYHDFIVLDYRKDYEQH